MHDGFLYGVSDCTSGTKQRRKFVATRHSDVNITLKVKWTLSKICGCGPIGVGTH